MALKLRDFSRNKPSQVTLTRHCTVILTPEVTNRVSNQVVILKIYLTLTKMLLVRASITQDLISLKRIGKQTLRISDLWSKDSKEVVTQISSDPQLIEAPLGSGLT